MLSEAQIDAYFSLYFAAELTADQAAEAERLRAQAEDDERERANLVGLELQLLRADVLEQVRETVAEELQVGLRAT